MVIKHFTAAKDIHVTMEGWFSGDGFIMMVGPSSVQAKIRTGSLLMQLCNVMNRLLVWMQNIMLL